MLSEGTQRTAHFGKTIAVPHSKTRAQAKVVWAKHSNGSKDMSPPKSQGNCVLEESFVWACAQTNS